MLKKFIYTSIAQYINVAIAFLAMVLTVYYYGVDGRGVYAAAYALVSTFGLIFGWSLGRASVGFNTENTNNINAFFQNKLFTVLMAFVLLALVGCLLFFLSMLVFPGVRGQVPMNYLFAMLPSLPYFMWQYSGRFFYSQIGKINVQNTAVVINRALFIAFLAYFVMVKKCSLLALVVTFSVANGLSFLIELAIFCGLVKPRLVFDNALFKNIFVQGSIVHIDSIFSYFMFTINILVVNIMLGVKAAGIYSIVMQFYSVLFIFPTVGQILIQRSLVTKLNENTLFADVKHYYLLSCAIAFCLIPVVYYLMDYVFLFTHTSAASQVSFKLFVSMIPAYLSMSLTHILNPILVFYGKINSLLKYTVVLSGANVLFLMVALKSVGLFGASFVVFFIYTLLIFIYKKLLNTQVSVQTVFS